MEPNKKLEDAIRKRSEFLEKNPYMKKYQEEIDTILDRAVTPQNRLAILSFMMAERAAAAFSAAHKLVKELKEEIESRERNNANI